MIWSGGDAAWKQERFDGCPLCGCAERKLEVVAPSRIPGFADLLWSRCTGCGHISTFGHFTGEALVALLAGASDKQEPRVAMGDEALRLACGRLMAAIAQHAWRPRGAERGTLLDVGFGGGALMATARELGWRVGGVEVRETCRAQAGAEGFVTWASIAEAGGPWSVVTLCDVIEHVPDPRGLLAECAGVLAPGGLLVVATPNENSPAWRALGANNPYWRETEHFHVFTPGRVDALAAELGLAPVERRVSELYRLGVVLIYERTDRPARVVPL